MRKKSTNKQLNICIKPEVFAKIQESFANTTCRTISDYCRKLILSGPVKAFYRNQSFDEFMQEAVLLRKELHTLCNRVSLSRSDEGRLLDLVAGIKEKISQIADICLQE